VTPVTVSSSVLTKHMFNTIDLTNEDVETILWTALDLKKAVIDDRITVRKNFNFH